jgi:hypothetical protein
MTPALALAWDLAAREAVRTRHEVIQPVHLLLGLLKLESLSNSPNLLNGMVPERQVSLASSEINALMATFGRHGIRPVTHRRELRSAVTLKSSLPYNRKPEGMHRSMESRKIFERASAITEQQSLPFMTCFHLLVALLEPREGLSWVFLIGKDVNCDRLREDALEFTRTLLERGAQPPAPLAPPASCMRRSLARARSSRWRGRSAGRPRTTRS